VQANDAVHRLDQDSEFVIKAILAENDDRAAYEALVKQVDDPTFRHSKSAKSVATSVQGVHYKSERPYLNVNWDATATNRYSWDISHINSAWSMIDGRQAKDFIQFVWDTTNTTKEQRISFLRNAYLNDSHNSLEAANRAADLVAEQLGAKYNPPFNYADVERRWTEFSNTNHLFTKPKNLPTNLVYEIIPPSSTNRATVLREWGKTKLVLFRLEHPAIPGTVEAMYFNCSENTAENMAMANTNYLNTIWALFNNWGSDGMKCEFKYEPDLSKTNVQSVSVKANKMIFDGSFEWPINPP
jgi:hypothetical protein